MIDFALVTLDGTKSKQDVYEIILPTPDGYMAVLPHHIPLVSLVSAGVVSVRSTAHTRDDELEIYAVSGGVIDIEDNHVRILVDEASASDDVNEQAAQAAYEAARRMLAEAKTQVELAEAQTMVDREAARLHVATLRRHKRPKI